MAAFDLEALKQYVRMDDQNQYQQLAPGTVSLLITHQNLKQQWPEIRMDLRSTIGAIKDRLYRHCGTGAGFQRLLLKDNRKTLCELAPDDRMLGFFGVKSGMEIHILDTDAYSFSKNGALENINCVPKYVMSDSDYEKRPDSLRNYKKKMQETDPLFTFLSENRRQPKELNPPSIETLEPFRIGARCEIMPGSRRGKISWKGTCSIIGDGAWIGVSLDEPRGKGDGSVCSRDKEIHLFSCEPNHAAFVRPNNCIMGDFPEVNLLTDLDSSSEDEL